MICIYIIKCEDICHISWVATLKRKSQKYWTPRKIQNRKLLIKWQNQMIIHMIKDIKRTYTFYDYIITCMSSYLCFKCIRSSGDLILKIELDILYPVSLGTICAIYTKQ